MYTVVLSTRTRLESKIRRRILVDAQDDYKTSSRSILISTESPDFRRILCDRLQDKFSLCVRATSINFRRVFARPVCISVCQEEA
eukprot:SAG31_NODE_1099_length_9914_cov_6.721345_6_plen_85_part_00